MFNVFSYDTELVGILKEGTPTKVITAAGAIKDVEADKLVPTRLVIAGVYHQDFMQAALGGLVEPPKFVRGLVIYSGAQAKAIVEPIGHSLVKYAAGIPNDAFVMDPPNKINTGKMPDFDKLDKKDNRAGNGPGGENQGGKKPMDEITDLEGMGNDDVPATLSIADDTQLSNVKQVIIKWDNPQINGSIEDIKALFGEGQVLGNPTVITIDTGEEKITSKRGSDGAKRNKKQAYYGPTPTMATSCPKCQSRVLYKRDPKDGEVTLECPVCSYKYKYEGSIGDKNGVSGQTDPS